MTRIQAVEPAGSIINVSWSLYRIATLREAKFDRGAHPLAKGGGGREEAAKIEIKKA